jgi:hypothetical protein
LRPCVARARSARDVGNMERVWCCRANDTRRSQERVTPNPEVKRTFHERTRCNGSSRAPIEMSAICKQAGSTWCARTRQPPHVHRSSGHRGDRKSHRGPHDGSCRQTRCGKGGYGRLWSGLCDQPVGRRRGLFPGRCRILHPGSPC